MSCQNPFWDEARLSSLVNKRFGTAPATPDLVNIEEDTIHSKVEEDGDGQANVVADMRVTLTSAHPSVPHADCASPGTELALAPSPGSASPGPASPGTELARAESILDSSLLPRDMDLLDTLEEDMGTAGFDEEEAVPNSWAQHVGDLVAIEEGRQGRQVSGEGEEQDWGEDDSPVLGGAGLGRG